MKISPETTAILKNFAHINQGIFFKQGNVISTMSPQKNILADATISETIPQDFGIYDLNNFLSVTSLFKEGAELEFDDKHVIIKGRGGRSKIKYRFCEPTMIVTPPEKGLTMPDPEISFELKSEDFDWILRAASVLSSPQIAVESDGEKVNVVTLDLQNDSAHTESLEIANESGNKYRMIFKTENISKIMPGTYEVSISSKGISNFKNKTIPLQYWITTEQGSNFQKA